MMPSSLYTDEVKLIVRSVKFPKGLRADVVEYKDYLGFRLYRDNFESFSGEDKLFISAQIKKLFEIVRGYGCPFYLEVEKGNGISLDHQ